MDSFKASLSFFHGMRTRYETPTFQWRLYLITSSDLRLFNISNSKAGRKILLKSYIVNLTDLLNAINK